LIGSAARAGAQSCPKKVKLLDSKPIQNSPARFIARWIIFHQHEINEGGEGVKSLDWIKAGMKPGKW
jgi:hypothetical protein